VRRFRAELEAAGVDRPELYESSDTRQPIRLHDLRATFITVGLANGKSEAWVADRTGHKSSVMINRYRRSARLFVELDAGPLEPLDRATPELAEVAGGVTEETRPAALERRRANAAKAASSPADSRGRIRTGTPLRTADFESAASAIPPLGRVLRQGAGFSRGDDGVKRAGVRA